MAAIVFDGRSFASCAMSCLTISRARTMCALSCVTKSRETSWDVNKTNDCFTLCANRNIFFPQTMKPVFKKQEHLFGLNVSFFSWIHCDCMWHFFAFEVCKLFLMKFPKQNSKQWKVPRNFFLQVHQKYSLTLSQIPARATLRSTGGGVSAAPSFAEMTWEALSRGCWILNLHISVLICAFTFAEIFSLLFI